jgi:hypothetical protein
LVFRGFTFCFTLLLSFIFELCFRPIFISSSSSIYMEKGRQYVAAAIGEKMKVRA